MSKYAVKVAGAGFGVGTGVGGSEPPCHVYVTPVVQSMACPPLSSRIAPVIPLSSVTAWPLTVYSSGAKDEWYEAAPNMIPEQSTCVSVIMVFSPPLNV